MNTLRVIVRSKLFKAAFYIFVFWACLVTIDRYFGG